jgi:Flp pilus assembly protein TadB
VSASWFVAPAWAALAAWVAAGLLHRSAGPPRRSPPGAARTLEGAPDDPDDRPERLADLVQRRSVQIAATIAVAAVGVAVFGAFPALLVAGVASLWRRAGPVIRARRRRRQVEAEIPGMIELLVLTVRAGMTLHQTVRLLARTAPPAVRPAFEAVVHRLDRGAALADALGALPDTLGRSAVPIVDTLGPADRYGLPLGPALEQLAREARRVRRQLDEAAARRLPVQMSFPLVTCTLPAFVLLAIAPALVAAVSSLGSTAR